MKKSLKNTTGRSLLTLSTETLRRLDARGCEPEPPVAVTKPRTSNICDITDWCAV